MSIKTASDFVKYGGLQKMSTEFKSYVHSHVDQPVQSHDINSTDVKKSDIKPSPINQTSREDSKSSPTEQETKTAEIINNIQTVTSVQSYSFLKDNNLENSNLENSNIVAVSHRKSSNIVGFLIHESNMDGVSRSIGTRKTKENKSSFMIKFKSNFAPKASSPKFIKQFKGTNITYVSATTMQDIVSKNLIPMSDDIKTFISTLKIQEQEPEIKTTPKKETSKKKTNAVTKPVIKPAVDKPVKAEPKKNFTTASDIPAFENIQGRVFEAYRDAILNNEKQTIDLGNNITLSIEVKKPNGQQKQDIAHATYYFSSRNKTAVARASAMSKAFETARKHHNNGSTNAGYVKDQKAEKMIGFKIAEEINPEFSVLDF